jgi:hypothetical protein
MAMPPLPVITEAAVLAVLHVPPDIALLKVVVAPKQIFRVPVMAADTGFTVAVIVAAQPLEMNV